MIAKHVRTTLIAISAALLSFAVFAPSAAADEADEAAAFAAKYGITYPWPLAEDDDQPRTVEIVTEQQGIVRNEYVQDSLVTVLKQMVSIRKKPPAEQAEIADWIAEHHLDLPSPFLLEASRIKFDTEPLKAAELFFMSTARTGYDGLRCVDRTSVSGLDLIERVSIEIFQRINLDQSLKAEGRRTARQRKDILSHRVSPWWFCSHGVKAMIAASDPQMDGTLPVSEWLIPREQWQEKQTTVLDALEKG